MKLGNAGQYVIGTKVYDETLDFVRRLQLKIVDEGTSSQGTKFTLFTDGRSNILVDETNYPENYGGLIYFNDKLEELIPELKDLGINPEEIKQGDQLFSAMFLTPDNVAINVVNATHKGSPNPRGDTSVDFGKFGEYAIKIENLDESISIWEKLGFKSLYRDDKWNYAILSDDIFVIGLHAHEMDDRAALTYFHGDMPEKINELKERGVSFKSEKPYKIGEKDALDATAETPDGQIWYFFTGEV